MRTQERGSAMLVTMIVITSLFAGSAILVVVTLLSTRSSDVTRSGMSATYCAEAGLEAAHPAIAGSYGAWPATMCTSATEAACVPATVAAEAPMFAGINHDLDGDGSADFVVYLRDNDDEVGVQDYAADTDHRVFVVSTCVKFPDSPRQVKELVTLSGGTLSRGMWIRTQ